MIANDDQGNNGDHGNNSAKPVRHILVDSTIIVDGDMLDTAVIELFRNLRETVNAKPKPEMNEALAEQRRCIRVLRAIGRFIAQAWCEPRACSGRIESQDSQGPVNGRVWRH
jgi:hypothetical protein